MKPYNIIIFITLAVVTVQCIVTDNLSTQRLKFNGEELQLLYITPSTKSTPCQANPCLTLSMFAQNSSSWLTSNTLTLMFLSGSHTLNTELSILNITNFSMLTNITSELAHTISCQHHVSLNFENMTKLLIKGLKFIGCGGNMFSSVRNFVIENSTFLGQNNSGTVLDITNINLMIVNGFFFSNNVGRCKDIFEISIASNISVRVGGVIYVDKSNVTIINCTFVNNSAEVGGAIYSTHYEFKNNISISNSTFVSNRANTYSGPVHYCNWPSNPNMGSAAGVIAVFQSRLKITNCMFINNTSEVGEGGVLSILQQSALSIYKSVFQGNTANSSGGVLMLGEADVTIDSCAFISNSANQGGVIHALQLTTIMLRWSVFGDNIAKSSGGVLSMDQTSHLNDDCGRFLYNRATTGGVLYSIRSGIVLQNSVLSHNHANERGGAIYVLQSHTNITLLGQCNLTHNSASTGGAICAIESTIVSLGYIYFQTLFSRLTVAFNTANYIGGGLYLHRSVLNSKTNSATYFSNNSASSSGGGIYATNSLIICTEYYRQMDTWPFQTLINFTNNSAVKGGGLFLESGSQLRIQKVSDVTNLLDAKLNTSIHFTSNTAEYGTAVYVADETYLDVCGNLYGTINSTATSNADCFIQVFSEATIIAKTKSSVASVEFSTKDISKGIIFGGLLDRCIPDPHRAEIYTNKYIQKQIDGFTYLKLISNLNNTDYISSLPVRVCFCTPDYQPDCSYEAPTVHVKKGESFNVSLVTVDQVNRTLKNVIVHSSPSHTESSLGEGQTIQQTADVCTNLTFRIYSLHTSEGLILYADGPCRNASRSQRRVYVVFQPCKCPIGFQPTKDNTDCVCVCDSRLNPYFSVGDNNCNIQNESLARHGNFWIGFINDTAKDKNSSEFLIYPYCPLDYCLPPTSTVHINLNLINGADAQCANNRSGLLCSLCQPGLSLSLGSSRCIPCSKTWYSGCILIISITIIAGIVLVVLLLTLNLTVASGTLNGLIFYANIIGTNSSIFFSGLSPSTKYYSILISWLNLEVGFDVCFFDGMDTYWKSWLQLAFPMYVISLVAIVIIVSKYSTKFTRLISKRNPVATLDTLILLSYTKFLQATIATLSSAHLDYPDGSHKRVWLPDATIEYLSKRHIPLFVVAIAILTVGIAYTCTIFFWQWFFRYQDKTIFKAINVQRLYNFIDPYHAPYVKNHRYWTGLLLFMRIALYLVFALNVSGDPGVNMLAISLSAFSLLLFKAKFGQIYQKSYIDVIEMACYANVGIFSMIKLKFNNGKMVDITAHISGAFTVMLLAVVITYHSVNALILNSKCSKRHTNIIESQLHESSICNDTAVSKTLSKESHPTYSVVDLESLTDCKTKQSSAKVATGENNRLSRHTLSSDSEMDDDSPSLCSTDSKSPLLGECDWRHLCNYDNGHIIS